MFPSYTSLWGKNDYLTTKVPVDMATKWSCNLYGLEVQVRCLVSLNSASLSIDPLVWLYEAIILVVPAHISLWEKIDHLTTTKMLIW